MASASTIPHAPTLPYDLPEDMLAHLVAHTLHHLDASTNLPTFLPPPIAHTLLCTLPDPPQRLANLIFIRLYHCQPATCAARGDMHLIRRIAYEREQARVKFGHWHRSPWSLSHDTSGIEWVQSVAAGASRRSKVHVLDWLVRQPETTREVWMLVCTSAAVVNVSSNPVVVASAFGAVGALAWWRHVLGEHGWMNGERECKLAVECMVLATARGHVEAVAWWTRQFDEDRVEAGGAKWSKGRVWERVEAQVKWLGMDAERFKRSAAAVVAVPTGGLALRVGASP